MFDSKQSASGRALVNSFALLSLGAVLIVFVGYFLAEDRAGFWVLHLGTLIAVAGYFGVGGWAWLRRPSNSIGFLTVAAGFSLLIGVFFSASMTELASLGGLFSILTLALTAHILLSFPDGKLATIPARIVAAAAYLAAVIFQALQTMSAMQVLETGGAWSSVLRVTLIASVAILAVGGAAVLIVRLLRAPPKSRAALLPLYLYGAVAIFAVPYLPALLPPSLLLYYLQLLLLLGVPVVFAITASKGRFSRLGEINSLGVALGASWEVPGDLSVPLARIFGDPEAKVVFWSEEQHCFLSYEGEELVAPPEFDESVKLLSEDRSRITLRHQGVTVGAILFHPQIVIDVALVQSAARVLVLAVERGQLTAQLKAKQSQLHESRLRLLTAADNERARIAQNLHDGVQAHLVLLTMEAGTLISEMQQVDGHLLKKDADPTADVQARLEELRRNIDLAASELRELVFDVMPPLLLERDLYDALEVLTDRVPISTRLTVSESLRQNQRELPDALLGTVYFVVAESLTNAMKHSQATAILVDVKYADDEVSVVVSDNGANASLPVLGHEGSTRLGLRGLRDRVETLGGVFELRLAAEATVLEPPGNSRGAFGLSVCAVIPCA